MTQPQYGNQQVPPGTIEINVQGNFLTSNMVPPTVTIDGHKINGVHHSAPVPVPVPPGRRHIEAHSQWMRRYGQAQLDVDVRPGETVRVFYAPPMHQFTTGNMGLEQQPVKGKGCMLAFLIVMVVVLILIVVTAVLTS